MEIKEYCIYSLDFAYTRISSKNNVEIDFRGVLSYHTKDVARLGQITQGILDLDSVNIFLSFQMQRHIDLILKDISEEEILNQRPIIVNRIKTIVRNELVELGLEFVSFKKISLWSHGATARGIAT